MKTGFTKNELCADIAFLLERAGRAGKFEMGHQRSWGISSNALVRAAYGGAEPAPDEQPLDKDDYMACCRAMKALPAHRRDGVEKVFRKMEVEFLRGELRRREANG